MQTELARASRHPTTQAVKKMSSVSVRKSSPAVIRPLEPTAMSALLVFEHLSRDATATIKGALSQALVHSSPFAGRISLSGGDDGGGEGFSIRCTGEGVEFVAASADCGLEEAKILDAYSSDATKALLDELAIFGSYGSGDEPLLSVQVTEFSCGGLVVGVTSSHAVADGVGIAQFLAAVGELARGAPSPSVIPARWDEAVFGLPPLFDPIRQAMVACPESLDMELVIPLDITVPWALINRIKAESSPCSVFEAVLAILWWCRVRATMSSSPGTTATRPVYLTFAANVRRHVGAKDGYYGNCVVNQLVAAAASAGVVDLARMIRRAKDQLPEKLKEEDDEGGRLMMRGLSARYDMLNVSSWRNVGFEQVDFGSGAPARVMFHGPGKAAPPVPICMVYPPCKGKDGVNVLSISMKKEHADAFLGELADLCKASVS